jgi:hypothetical protein
VATNAVPLSTLSMLQLGNLTINELTIMPLDAVVA